MNLNYFCSILDFYFISGAFVPSVLLRLIAYGTIGGLFVEVSEHAVMHNLKSIYKTLRFVINRDQIVKPSQFDFN